MRMVLLGWLVGLALSGARSESGDRVIVTFGREGLAAGLARVAGPAAEVVEVTEDDDRLVIRSPNFWSLLVQCENIPGDWSLPSRESRLAVEVRGEAPGDRPVLKLVLVSGDWQRKSTWTFDLGGVSDAEFRTISAEEAAGEPVSGEEVPLDLAGGEVPGHVQILTGAQGGDSPWSIELRSIRWTP